MSHSCMGLDASAVKANTIYLDKCQPNRQGKSQRERRAWVGWLVNRTFPGKGEPDNKKKQA